MCKDLDMGLFWINIGKAWSMLREEGIVRGGKRVCSYAARLFSRVPPGDVLIVTGGVGDSARYRAHHVAEELNLHGIRASVAHQDNPFLERYASRFSVFIFHRTLFTPRVEALFVAAKQLGKETLFETDDLVYDPQYIRETAYFQKMNALQRKLYEKGVGAEILTDPVVKTCTTTTSFLANKLRALGKNVFVVPNKLSKEDMEWIEEIRETWNKKHGTENEEQKSRNAIRNSQSAIDQSVFVAYFSGTASHDEDFATISDAVFRVLESRPAVKLVIAGPLILDTRFMAFRDRIVRLPFADRQEHFRNIASIDINLAPLIMGNPFCESKSELKFVEAGALAIPTVAAATGTFREAIQDGTDGFVAADTEEWRSKLLLLIDDATLRKRIGDRAEEKVMEKYTTERSSNDEYYEYLKERISK